MNFQNILSRKEMKYLEGAFAIVRLKWWLYFVILVMGLNWLSGVLIVASSGPYVCERYVFGFFKAASFNARLFDVGLLNVCAYLSVWLYIVFFFIISTWFTLIIDRLQMTSDGSIALRDKDYRFLQGLSLWLTKKSPRLWNLIIILLSLAEISREIYVDWGLSAAGLAFTFFLSPVLILPFIGIKCLRMIRIIEKIRGGPIQSETGQK